MNIILLSAAVVSTNLVVKMPPVIVEASYLEDDKSRIAAQVEVISREAIASSGARNVSEALSRRANIFLRTGGENPALAQVAMRGYGANSFGRVKIMVDGEELNNADMSVQNLMRVPLQSVERMEILQGPQSVLHGGNASAGVINISAFGEDFEEKTALEVFGGSFGRVGANVYHHGGIEEEEIAYYTDLNFERSDGERHNSWYETWSAKAGIRKTFENGAYWMARAFYASSGYGLPAGIYCVGAPNYEEYPRKYASDNSSKAKNEVYGISAAVKGVINEENSLTADFAFRQRRSRSYNYLKYDADTWEGKLKYDNQSGFWGLENEFAAGVNLKIDLLKANAMQGGISGMNNDFRRFTGGGFVRDEVQVMEEVSIFGGAREEWIHSRDQYRGAISGRESSLKRATAGEVGVNWRPVEGTKVFARWTAFYHAPMADEMFSSYGVPNMGLKPEVGHSAEVGMDCDFLEEYNFNVTGYHTELKDEIMYLNSGNENAPDKTRRDGIDAAITWNREKVASAGIKYSAVYARFVEGDYEGNRIPLVPEQLIRVFGEYWLTDWLSANGGCRYVGKQVFGGDFEGEGEELSGFGLFDVGVRATPTWSWAKGMTISLSVDNLFNERYCDYGEYFPANPMWGMEEAYYVYPGVGRSFNLAIKYEF